MSNSLIIITMLITIVLVLAGYYAYTNLPKEVVSVQVSEIPSEETSSTTTPTTTTTSEQTMPQMPPPMPQMQ